MNYITKTDDNDDDSRSNRSGITLNNGNHNDDNIHCENNNAIAGNEKYNTILLTTIAFNYHSSTT